MSVLVTGGSGFIGKALVQRLRREGSNVVIIDRRDIPDEFREDSGIKFIKGDIADRSIYSRIPKGVDRVFHLASQASGQLSMENPYEDVSTNLVGTLIIALWAKEIGVKSFVFTSSIGVYQDGSSPAYEDNQPNPRSFYGINKLSSEMYLKVLREEGLPATILRLTNIYGPGQPLDNRKQGMVSIYAGYLVRGEPLHVKGSLERYRDFVYIDDALDALLIFANGPKLHNVYNVCSGKKTTVRELIDQLLVSFSISEEESKLFVEGTTPRDLFGYYGSLKRLSDETGWIPKVSLSDGLQKLAESTRHNVEG